MYSSSLNLQRKLEIPFKMTMIKHIRFTKSRTVADSCFSIFSIWSENKTCEGKGIQKGFIAFVKIHFSFNFISFVELADHFRLVKVLILIMFTLFTSLCLPGSACFNLIYLNTNETNYFNF